jgi:hypothetical protein
MRILLLTTLLGVGCGDGALAGPGQPCISSAECAAGLLCDFGKMPHACAPNSSLSSDLALAPDQGVASDGGMDLSGTDQSLPMIDLLATD